MQSNAAEWAHSAILGSSSPLPLTTVLVGSRLVLQSRTGHTPVGGPPACVKLIVWPTLQIDKRLIKINHFAGHVGHTDRIAGAFDGFAQWG